MAIRLNEEVSTTSEKGDSLERLEITAYILTYHITQGDLGFHVSMFVVHYDYDPPNLATLMYDSK